MSRPKCIKCGSVKLIYWREKLVNEFFRIDKNGNYIFDHEGSDEGQNASGFECKNCGCKWNEYSNYIISEGDADKQK